MEFNTCLLSQNQKKNNQKVKRTRIYGFMVIRIKFRKKRALYLIRNTFQAHVKYLYKKSLRYYITKNT